MLIILLEGKCAWCAVCRNKTKYFRLRRYDTVWVLSDYSLSALLVLSECSLNALWVLLKWIYAKKMKIESLSWDRTNERGLAFLELLTEPKIFFVWAERAGVWAWLANTRGESKVRWRAKPGRKLSQETMTWYQSITSKVNYAGGGSWGRH